MLVMLESVLLVSINVDRRRAYVQTRLSTIGSYGYLHTKSMLLLAFIRQNQTRHITHVHHHFFIKIGFLFLNPAIFINLAAHRLPFRYHTTCIT